MKLFQRTTEPKPKFDTWAVPSLFPTTLIKAPVLDEWCERLAGPLTELIQTHKMVLAALNGQGEPALTDRWLELLNQDTHSREAHGVHPDFTFYSIDDVPGSLLRQNQDMVQTELRLIMKARGMLDARQPGVRMAKTYHDFALRFIFNLWLKASKQRLGANGEPTLEQVVGVAFWGTILSDFEDSIFLPSFDDEEEVPLP